MSNNSKSENRKSSNAGRGGKRNRRNQGANTRFVRGRPCDGERRKGKSVNKASFDQARPIENPKRKRHKGRKITKGDDVRTTKSPHGKYPRKQNLDDQRWVPWIEVNNFAQVHHYYFVIREMLEGSFEKPELGVPQLDLNGREASVESVLTTTPRLMRDWRTFVGVLRMLHEDGYVPASFVERMLRTHPLTGARSVKVVEDLDLKKDFIEDRCVKSNVAWVKEAEESYERALTYKKAEFVEEFVGKQKELYPNASEEDHTEAANKIWNQTKQSIVLMIDVGDRTVSCRSKERYVKAHMARRAVRDADRLPTLYRLRGGVRYKVLEDNQIVEKGDFVNVEFAVKPNGGIWLQAARGKRGKVSSPFRKHYARMKSNADEPSFIDDIDVPEKVLTDQIQRPPVPKRPEINDDMSLSEIVEMMSDKTGEVPSRDISLNKKGNPVRKVEPRRGKARAMTSEERESLRS